MIGIVNYGMGNIRSIESALKFLDANSKVLLSSKELKDCAKIILPGVGSYSKAIQNIDAYGWREPLNEFISTNKPVLGICLGMQLFADFGEEGGESRGLGWIKGRVKKISTSNPDIKVPHIGFNTVQINQDNLLFRGLPSSLDFYFVHSYHFRCDNNHHVAATVTHGEKLTAAVRRDALMGVQFHPEKSQKNGLKVLQNFINS